MQNLAKRKTTFLQDIPFISICFNINTNKCKILQKRKRQPASRLSFGFYARDARREWRSREKQALVWVLCARCETRVAKPRESAARLVASPLAFRISRIKPKREPARRLRKRLFRKIFHLLVCVSVLILVNAQSCPVVEITVGHRTLSDQISKLSDQFCHMVGHDVRTRKTSVPLKILFSDYICFKTILK